MGDLYGNSGAIALGNMRTKMVRDMNEKVKKHNDTVQNTIQGLQDQASSAFLTKEIRDQAINLWTGKDIPGKVGEFNKYYADRASAKAKKANPVESTQENIAESDNAPKVEDAMTPEQETGATDAPAGEPVNEGATQGESVAEVAESAEADVSKGLEASLSGAESVAKSGGEAVAKSVGEKASGLLGKAGVLGSAALGGYDLYEDIKHKKIEGNNTWEKASNLLQIGGTLGDLVGTFFPPAKLIGGVLDLASGVTDSVGEKVEEDQKSKDLKAEQQKETQKSTSVAQQEKTTPSLIATTALTATTGRVQ